VKKKSSRKRSGILSTGGVREAHVFRNRKPALSGAETGSLPDSACITSERSFRSEATERVHGNLSTSR
jgi:hypothetical protein